MLICVGIDLAARLGPDLVREMEVHIKPGAYMPSFAIRKDLQERYAVDRRHLYDYFHSRGIVPFFSRFSLVLIVEGLRVAKEERFNNLARSRQKKAQEKATGPMKEVRSPHSMTCTSSIIPWLEHDSENRRISQAPGPSQTTASH